MAARFDLVTIDTPDVDRLAGFWAAALALVEVEREDVDRWVVLADRGGVRRIGLQRGTHRPGGTHLDLACDPTDFDDEVARLLALGATLVAPARREPYGSIANPADPDGNAFDLNAYDGARGLLCVNRKPSGHARSPAACRPPSLSGVAARSAPRPSPAAPLSISRRDGERQSWDRCVSSA